MIAGETRSVSVTLKNTGISTWGSNTDTLFFLTSWPFTATQLSGKVHVSPSSRSLSSFVASDVPPGGTLTAAFTLTAPQTPGIYAAQYKMLHHRVAWFGEACGPSTLTVAAPSSVSTSSAYAISTFSTNAITWSADGKWMPLDWQTLPYDARITSVTFNTNWKKGANADYCLLNYRDVAPTSTPLSGSYTDIFCINILQSGSDGPWTKTYDMSANPIFLPANTKFRCSGSGGHTTLNSGFRSCTVTFEKYTDGQPRYRIFRIPYMDTMISATSTFPASWYRASTTDPLRVKGYIFFNAVSTGTYTACARRLNGVNGSVLVETCQATTTKSSVKNNEPPGFIPLNWTLHYPDMLSARCTIMGAKNPSDCAFYFIVEIPPTITPSPENVFRDYGNIPAPLLKTWCTNYIKKYIVSSQALQLCGYSMTGCTQDVQIQKCIGAFPAANCMLTNTCKQ